jgi:GT2 family glycosyltransferase
MFAPRSSSVLFSNHCEHVSEKNGLILPIGTTANPLERAIVSMQLSVLASVVTYNSAEHIVACVESLLAQTFHPMCIVVTDNASSDGSAEIVEAHFGTRVRLIRNDRNLGFSKAHNDAIRSTDCSYVLTLNPDAVLQKDFVAILAGFLENHPHHGSVSGKLYRMNATHAPVRKNGRLVLDSTGMEFLPNQRHRDRGAGQEDDGRFSSREEVFGTTAAAGFYRRAMLEDVALHGEYFDEGFFIYREDVDLAWRARLYGWGCGFEPEAIGYHVRQGIPERRSLLSAEINYHSTKNRFLLRVKNMPLGMFFRHLPAIAARDLLVLGYALAKEHYSLRAVSFLRTNWRLYMACRREIEKRRRIGHHEIERWIRWGTQHVPLEAESVVDQPRADPDSLLS